MHGTYPIIKPKGPTSHDIIYKIRKISREKRVGHAGTLDPLASGVLIIAVGREFTKQLEKHVQAEKEYIATLKLGENSTTDDEQGQKTGMNSSNTIPTKTKIDGVLKKFVGTIEQLPPLYSSIKVRGMPAHRRVRKGQQISLQPRSVEIKEIELLEYTFPIVKIRVKTGKGVYIRALARDIGQELETGAYLADLIRTQVGQFRIENALTLEQFATLIQAEQIDNSVK